MVIKLTDADREKVSAAIAAAEARSSGEIVAVATPISDAYHDVGLHWALVPLFAVLAWRRGGRPRWSGGTISCSAAGARIRRSANC